MRQRCVTCMTYFVKLIAGRVKVAGHHRGIAALQCSGSFDAFVKLGTGLPELTGEERTTPCLSDLYKLADPCKLGRRAAKASTLFPPE